MGLTSAVFVLVLFDIPVTLVEGPDIATVGIVVPLLFVLLYEVFVNRFRSSL